MKISSRSSALMLTATALLAISACGGSDASGQNNVPVSAYQKNAAIIGADGNYQMAPPPTPVKATTTAPTTMATTISSVTTAATTAPSTTEFKGPNFTKPTTCSQINRKLGKC